MGDPDRSPIKEKSLKLKNTTLKQSGNNSDDVASL